MIDRFAQTNTWPSAAGMRFVIGGVLAASMVAQAEPSEPGPFAPVRYRESLLSTASQVSVRQAPSLDQEIAMASQRAFDRLAVEQVPVPRDIAELVGEHLWDLYSR